MHQYCCDIMYHTATIKLHWLASFYWIKAGPAWLRILGERAKLSVDIHRSPNILRTPHHWCRDKRLVLSFLLPCHPLSPHHEYQVCPVLRLHCKKQWAHVCFSSSPRCSLWARQGECATTEPRVPNTKIRKKMMLSCHVTHPTPSTFLGLLSSRWKRSLSILDW